MCPNCGRLPIRDYNAFPQHMWERDVQDWYCENCTTLLTRSFVNSRWTPWVEKERENSV